jgi:hypothetical protein
MSQTQPNATKYNDGNTDARTNLLRTAKVEESQIAAPSKITFRDLAKRCARKAEFSDFLSLAYPRSRQQPAAAVSSMFYLCARCTTIYSLSNSPSWHLQM